MVIIGLDTVFAFELEIANEQKSRQHRPNKHVIRRNSCARPSSQSKTTTRPVSAVTSGSEFVVADFETKPITSSINASGVVTPVEFLMVDTSFNNGLKTDPVCNLDISNSLDTECSRSRSQVSVLDGSTQRGFPYTELYAANFSQHVSGQGTYLPDYNGYGSNSTTTRPKSCTSDVSLERNISIKRRPKTCVPRTKQIINSVLSKPRPKTSFHRPRPSSSMCQTRPLGQSRSGRENHHITNRHVAASTPEQEQYPQDVAQNPYIHKRPIEGDSTGLLGSSMNYASLQPRATWSMCDSQIGIHRPAMGNLNTPRILELDINRMMIGQNTISAHIGSPGLSSDRLVNAANNNLRAYMTVNRPGPTSAGKTEQQASVDVESRHSPGSSTPTYIPPLPPIGTPERPRSSSSQGRISPARIPVGNELPESPPGSSLRQSPVQETDANDAPSII